MRGATATAVSLTDSRMHDSSDRAEACRSACVTRETRTPAWKSDAAAPLRTPCVPKMEASPPAVQMVLLASARKARVERMPASWKDVYDIPEQPRIQNRKAGMPTA